MSASPTANTFAYEYRGQGPPWGMWVPPSDKKRVGYVQGMSCALDVCIVAGMYMGAGRINADSSSPPPAADGIRDLFLRLCGTDWRALSEEEGLKAKNTLYRLVLNERPEQHLKTAAIEMLAGTLMAVSGKHGIWSMCATGLGQFSFTGYTIRRCSVCSQECLFNNNQPFFAEVEVSILARSNCRNLLELVQQYFDGQPSDAPCTNCESTGNRFIRRVLTSEPPLRMAVAVNKLFARETLTLEAEPDGQIPDNFNIRYFCCGEASARTAAYKWIGGIYKSKAHYRLYWDDNSHLNPRKPSSAGSMQCELEARQVSLYDGNNLLKTGKRLGLIIGGIPAADTYLRVPSPWHNGADLLFYERIA
ncbi:MAG: hypothetical protein M1829_002590 [Trizodia sp. TS-e1964]|nr:MAG: hypothetical protein M1829_002590 [Trizodia sp. TS-e1964]